MCAVLLRFQSFDDVRNVWIFARLDFRILFFETWAANVLTSVISGFVCMHVCTFRCWAVGMDRLFCSGRVMRFHLWERHRKGSPLVGVGECLCTHVRPTCLSVCHCRAERGFVFHWTSQRFTNWLSGLVSRKLAPTSAVFHLETPQIQSETAPGF